MKLSEVLHMLEQVAPVSLSDEFCKNYSLYDNSGIIVNAGGDIHGALFALDLSEKAVSEAKKLCYNLIVTHHPAIYGGIKRLDAVNDPQARALADCLKSGISVISMHLNFDSAPEGIDYYLMRGLGGRNAETLCKLNGGAYGRVYGIEPVSFDEYKKRVSCEFASDKILFYGENKIIKKVASFCGAGCDGNSMAFAIENSADVFVSSDLKHHEITGLLQRGINVIHMTHYASENYGFNKIYQNVKNGELPSAYFNDGLL